MPTPAIILVGHGSPDPEWAAPIEQVANQMRAQNLGALVATAYLSGGAASLDRALAEVVDAGATRAVVLACLLSGGGRHVKRDLPELVDAARTRWPALTLELVPGALGSDEAVVSALAQAGLRRVTAAAT